MLSTVLVKLPHHHKSIRTLLKLI